MHEIVTATKVGVLQMLGSRTFAPIELTPHIARSSAEAISLARRLKPDIIMLDLDIPEIDGRTVCREIRASSDLSRCRILLFSEHSIDRRMLDESAALGCDDLCRLPVTPHELITRVTTLLGMQHLRARRISGELVDASLRGQTWTAGIRSLSSQEAILLLTQPVGELKKVRIRLTRQPGERVLVVDGKVSWVREGGRVVAVEFDKLSSRENAQLEALALWDVVEEGGNLQRVFLEGRFSEASEFALLAEHLRGVVDFDAAGIQHINSLGSRRWTRFLGNLGAVTKYTFSRCSLVFISQACLIPEVLGRGHVTSFMAPYVCEQCRHEELRLLATAELPAEGRKLFAPRFRCLECLAPLEFSEELERYAPLVQRAQTAS